MQLRSRKRSFVSSVADFRVIEFDDQPDVQFSFLAIGQQAIPCRIDPVIGIFCDPVISRKGLLCREYLLAMAGPH